MSMTGKELKEIRCALGWTIFKAVSMWPAGRISERTWRNWETGKHPVPLFVEPYMTMKKAVDMPPPMPQPTPAHLEFFRKTFSLTQDKAATLVGVSRVTWSRWERGHVHIPAMLLPTLRELAQKLKEEKGDEPL